MQTDTEIVVTALPIFENGYVVHHLPIRIRACFDQAIEAMYGNPYFASDVWFEDAEQDRRAFSDDRARSVLAQIKKDQPLVWAEIEAAASAHSIAA